MTAVRARRIRRMGQLADLVAAASRQLGFTKQAGGKMWREIRAELGEQAR